MVLRRSGPFERGIEPIIVNSPDPVTLLGGGEATAVELAEALSLASCLVAADGGAALALSAGHMPQAVIGDMDSLPHTTRSAIPPERLHPIPEQDSTDFDKALRSISAPFVLGLGFLGLRVDHQLANFSVLVQRLHPPCLLLGAHDVIFAAPPDLDLTFDLAPFSRVSLFPMAPVTGWSDGLEWPISGIPFAPAGRIGTSNRAVQARVTLRFDAAGMLVILPRAALVSALAVLQPAPATK